MNLKKKKETEQNCSATLKIMKASLSANSQREISLEK